MLPSAPKNKIQIMEINYKGTILSSEYNKEDEAMCFVEDGLKYSCDGLRLLKATDKCSDKVKIWEGVLVICDVAFSNCRVSEVVMPDSLVLIGKRAFEASELEVANIPRNVLEIGFRTFSECFKLKQVLFEDVRNLNIGKEAFHNCHNLGPKYKTEIEKRFGLRVFKGLFPIVPFLIAEETKDQKSLIT